jgi:hypothetical protein
MKRRSSTSTSAQPKPRFPQQEGDVPGGWKLVPIEPTEAMLDAWLNESINGAGGEGRSGEMQCYRAMIEAAPSSSVKGSTT